jgi:hypothetical protein
MGFVCSHTRQRSLASIVKLIGNSVNNATGRSRRRQVGSDPLGVLKHTSSWFAEGDDWANPLTELWTVLNES